MNTKYEVQKILKEKLVEMSKLTYDDCLGEGEYNGLCAMMNDIAKTILDIGE